MAKYLSVKEYTDDIQLRGYRCITVQEGALNDQELYIHSDTIRAKNNGERNPKYIILITPHYLNSWQNYFTIQKFRTLPKKYEHLVDSIFS